VPDSVVLIVALLTFARASLPWRLGITGVALGLLFAAAVLLLFRAHIWIPLLVPGTGLVVLGLVHGGSAYLREERERHRLRCTFERYGAPSVVEEILADPADAEGMLRGRLLPATILFSDLKGFTQLTNRRSRSGEIELHVRQLNQYLAAMVEVITALGGTIDKFIGDAVMAVFGSPLGRGPRQEAASAAQCALAMGQRLGQLNESWRRQGITALANGVGLARGLCWPARLVVRSGWISL
jgi:adenylate cyclase